MTRREWLLLAAFAGERLPVVRRHNPVIRRLDEFAPLSVGNGEFAFTGDVTGLQTFPAEYGKGIPLCTMSQWGWHSYPGRPPGELKLAEYDTYGRAVGYPTSAANQKELFNYLRENPHRLHLGRIGLRTQAKADQLSGVYQTLDLATGVIRSEFRLAGKAYRVRTACHPTLDCLAVEIEGDDPEIEIEFPYGSPEVNAADWERPERHTSALRGSVIERAVDGTRYSVGIRTEGPVARIGPHKFAIQGGTAVFHFTAGAPSPPEAKEVFAASEDHWRAFWLSGKAIDLSRQADKRAGELERRIVLSQYLTAIQCSGSVPPQETGLTANSWYGKFHLEMHWWHAAHFPMWGRTAMLSRSLDWYGKILPVAKETARRQGYRGARWPKMVGPEGIDSPSSIGPLLIWQQPHIIYLAELAKRYDLAELVFETAEFMASFAVEREGVFHLGPPVIPAQENHPPRETWDPTFELEYWRWGLEIAQKWRRRKGLEPEPRWENVRRRLAALPRKDGVYLAHANCPQTYTERNRDHPSMLMALGFLPRDRADRETMRATLRKVMREWKWEDTWGWDYPMTAMTAHRLGETRMAWDALLMDTPKNRYLPNGHNYQRPGLHLYLPGNGGLLAAAAMMFLK